MFQSSQFPKPEYLLMVKITQSLELHVKVDGNLVNLMNVFGMSTLDSKPSLHNLYELLHKIDQHNLCTGIVAVRYECSVTK